MDDKRQFWDKAAKSGLALGGISIAYMLISLGLTSMKEGFLVVIANILTPLLWITKLVGCILLLRYFLRNYYALYPDCTRRNVYNQGRAIALLSAAVFAAFNMAYYMYINPGLFEETLKTIASLGVYNSEQLEILKEMEPQIPTYSFFGTLVYCYLFGSIASSFIVRKLIPSNPFK